MRKAFTLIELLVVIAIIAVLAVVVVLTLNPGQLILQSRDSTRLSDLASLQSAVALYQTDRAINGTVSLGSSSVVYVSIPDPAATTTAGSNCASLGLPSLPGSYTYHCAASSTFRKVDGSGWIPISLSSITSGAPLGQLPIDPVNTSSTRSYLTYTTNGTQYEVTSQIESSKYKLGGANDVASSDAGNNASLYEKGTNLTLQPLDYGDSSLVGYWTFDEGSGSIAYDYSGNNATGSWSGTLGSQWSTNARVGSYAGSFNGTNNSISIPDNAALRPTTALTVSVWFKQSSATYGGDLVSKFFGSGTAGWSLGTISQSPYPSLSTDGTSQSYYAFGTSAWSINAWHHLMMIYNGGAQSLQFYLDGQLYNSFGSIHGTIPSSIFAGTRPMDIGATLDGNTFPGLIDDVRIYNRALSATEVQALYNAGK